MKQQISCRIPSWTLSAPLPAKASKFWKSWTDWQKMWRSWLWRRRHPQDKIQTDHPSGGVLANGLNLYHRVVFSFFVTPIFVHLPRPNSKTDFYILINRTMIPCHCVFIGIKLQKVSIYIIISTSLQTARLRVPHRILPTWYLLFYGCLSVALIFGCKLASFYHIFAYYVHDPD